MNDLGYKIVYAMGYAICWLTTRPLVLHAERANRPGGYILASSHLTPYDVPALMACTPRDLDFLSIVEMLQTPFVGRFFRMMHCTFVDRSRNDPLAVLAMTHRLEAGRVVAMFPEGGIRRPEDSVMRGGALKPGVVKLAQMSNVPIVPVVVIGTDAMYRARSWLPLRSVRYGINYGMPIVVDGSIDPHIARANAMKELQQAYWDLGAELKEAMEGPARQPPPGVPGEGEKLVKSREKTPGPPGRR